jgi:hypothetical protein
LGGRVAFNSWPNECLLVAASLSKESISWSKESFSIGDVSERLQGCSDPVVVPDSGGNSSCGGGSGGGRFLARSSSGGSGGGGSGGGRFFGNSLIGESGGSGCAGCASMFGVP